jgi:hypothetical protein
MEDDIGFVYALVEREFVKTGEPVVKIGMSRKTPADRLRGYPKGSFFVWIRHTPTPVKDERLILETMRIWFRQRKDLGAEYFEGDQNVITGLLSALMQARESMRVTDRPKSEVDTSTPYKSTSTCDEVLVSNRERQSTIDAVSVFDAFVAHHIESLSNAHVPCERLYEMFVEFWSSSHPSSTAPRVGRSWLEKRCKERVGATIRPRFGENIPIDSGPMIAFPSLVMNRDVAEKRNLVKVHPLLESFKFQKRRVT